MNPEEYKRLSMQEQADIWPTLAPSDQTRIKAGQKTHRYEAILNQKSDKQRMVYIILALFLGCLGVHNFYAGRSAPAVVQLLSFIAGGFLLLIGIGLFLFIVLWIWVIVEICTVTSDGEGLKMT